MNEMIGFFFIYKFKDKFRPKSQYDGLSSSRLKAYINFTL